MYSKTQWIIRIGTVGLLLVLAASPLGAQSSERSFMRFGFMEPDEARDLFLNGTASFESGRFTQAAEKFREVLRRFPKNAIADRSSYMLIRSLAKLNRTSEALAQAETFQKEFPRSAWRDDVLEFQINLTNTVPPDIMAAVAQTAPQPPRTPRPAAAPAAPAPPAPAATAEGRAVIAVPGMGGTLRPGLMFGRAPLSDVRPEVRLQIEVLRVLFENDADRAIELSAGRLQSDPADPVVLSSLHMIAGSRSEKALPMLVTLARNSRDSRTRQDALLWIGRSRGEKDAIADLLLGLVPLMTGEEDGSAIAYALGQINTPKAYDALAAMARDKGRPERLRLDAIRSIGEARLANRLSVLEELYKAGMDSVNVRRQVVNSLSRGKEAQVVPLLARIASSDPDNGVKLSAVSGLGQIKTPEALKALETLLQKK